MHDIDSPLQLKALAELELRKRYTSNSDELQEKIEFWKQNPLSYIVERLQVPMETIDWAMNKQYDTHEWDGTVNPMVTLLNYLVSGIRRIGVESATGTGKTFILACIVYWFLECWKNSLVVTTAPKEDQLSLHIWKEMKRLNVKFGRGRLYDSLKLRMIPNSDEWIAIGFVAGIRADEESNTKAQGFHAEHMLIICEETPGIPAPILTALINTSVAPHNIVVAVGNPDHINDELHRFCGLKNAKSIRISAHDHPNLVLNNPSFIPGAVTQDSLIDLIDKYGSVEHGMYLSRGRGISPASSVDSLINMKWILDSFLDNNKRKDKIKELEEVKAKKALGVDVANSEHGDDASITKGIDNVMLSIDSFKCPDANQLGKRDVARIAKEDNISAKYIGVDGVGVGAGTVNALKEINMKVQNLQSGGGMVFTGSAEIFNNLRSQMYWQMREDLRLHSVHLLNDIELLYDLTAPKWEIKNGKICVESKEQIKKRLGRSPNKGDSAVYWNWCRKIRTQNVSVLK